MILIGANEWPAVRLEIIMRLVMISVVVSAWIVEGQAVLDSSGISF